MDEDWGGLRNDRRVDVRMEDTLDIDYGGKEEMWKG
jgi:hypothetical protein